MAGLRVPVISFVIGEGGSGGALGIAVSNKIFMLEYAVYSVISPEGCASILFRDAAQSPRAAESLRMTAKDVVGFGIADEIIPEPMGGAHQNWPELAETLKKVISKELIAYKRLSSEKIVAQRLHKFRQLGRYEDCQTQSKADTIAAGLIKER